MSGSNGRPRGGARRYIWLRSRPGVRVRDRPVRSVCRRDHRMRRRTFPRETSICIRRIVTGAPRMRERTRGIAGAPSRGADRISTKRRPAIIILRTIGIRPSSGKAISLHWYRSIPIRSTKTRSTVNSQSPIRRHIHTFFASAIKVTITRKTVNVFICKESTSV